MANRYLIIHGHFYQPPRENPWILAIEPQDSAAPFENWNARINRECYAPNARSRLLTAEGEIKKLINNYQYLSFNFGPTLLSWMETADPDTYARIVEADRAAAHKRDGHGPALAQVYNHIIMPLATERDKRTQVRWGIADFKRRYGRQPEGMWLAETAVDLATLQVMAEEGLKFTVLSQGQAGAVRPLAARPVKSAGRAAAKKTAKSAPPVNEEWLDVSGGRVDPREPYRVFWGTGPKDYIDVFFYDGPVSRSIAFENLLSDGRSLLSRVEQAFGQPKEDGSPRLVNLATDGESYGHHFQFGDMALAWLFNHLEEQKGGDPIVLTNYGQYLALFPPVKEARIIDATSWSCAHGVERWRSDCGCNTGGGRGQWNQQWREPLRNGLDWLGGQLAETFEREAGRFLADPWAARDDYIQVVIADYSDEARADFIRKHQLGELDADDRRSVFKLMESQLMSLYMFTSCAWFFDDISGLEPVQNLRYALRAMELAQPYTRCDLVEGLLKYLSLIVPNETEYPGGLDIWRRLVTPDSLSGRALAAHWAAAELLEAPEVLSLFSTPNFNTGQVTRLSGEGLEVMAGSVELFDRRLGGGVTYQCLGIYSGGTHLAILVGEPEEPGVLADWTDEKVLQTALGEELSALSTLSIWDSMVRLMPLASRFVMDDLLPHSRANLLSAMVSDVYDEIKNHTRDLFHLNQHLLMMHRSSGSPLSWVERFIFRVMGEAELKRILAPAGCGKPVNMVSLANVLNKRGLVGIAKDEPTLGELSAGFFDRSFRELETSTAPKRILGEIASFIKIVKEEDFQLDLWKSQNQWYDLLNDPAFMSRLAIDEMEAMREIGDLLGFAGMKKPQLVLVPSAEGERSK
ncbi:hypothetical protein C4J81_05000 [Deltaproteobacteria bacterium Smac51]|nr:hypothetical protein C4J81_05000 [Deltaproteobacteria bacterium Smac51]